ncbi:hypothetical protein COCNU_scaffold044891G000020 [Cocos nucifera]|nr:hypothetical protein [Cocos nucifera]
MIPEVAMEQYVNLLSEKIPGWRGEKTQHEAKHDDGSDSPMAVGSGKGTPGSSSSLFCQPSSLTERLSEDSSCTQGDDVGGPKPLKQGLTKAFLFNLLSPTRVTFIHGGSHPRYRLPMLPVVPKPYPYIGSHPRYRLPMLPMVPKPYPYIV